MKKIKLRKKNKTTHEAFALVADRGRWSPLHLHDRHSDWLTGLQMERDDRSAMILMSIEWVNECLQGEGLRQHGWGWEAEVEEGDLQICTNNQPISHPDTCKTMVSIDWITEWIVESVIHQHKTMTHLMRTKHKHSDSKEGKLTKTEWKKKQEVKRQ